MYTRREVTALAMAAPLGAAAAIQSVIHGVRFGLQSYVFSGVAGESDLDSVIRAMVDSKLGECDIFAPLYEPPEFAKARGMSPPASPEEAAARAKAQQDLAKWRASAPLEYFQNIRRKFADQGLEIYGQAGGAGSNEEEFERTFEIAKAFGVKIVNVSLGLAACRRLAPIAEKHEMLVGLQGRPDMTSTNPDAIAKPEDFEKGLALSKNFRLSFDIGDATGGGYDALKFVKDYHEKIAIVYVKDRKRNRLSVPFGEGDTPIKETLRYIRDSKSPIRCYMDCDHKPVTTRAEDVKKSYEYCKAALE